MGKLKRYRYHFDKETGIAEFTYVYGDKLLTGRAKCHEDDKDFQSERLGIKYAELRAFLLYLKYRRDELDQRIKSLEGSLNFIKQDPEYDEEAGYHKKHKKLITEAKTEVADIREAIKGITEGLKEDINARDKFYNGIRRLRKESE